MIKFNGFLNINEEVECYTHGNCYYATFDIFARRSTDELIISQIYNEDGDQRAMVLSGNQAKKLLRFLKQHVEDVEE